MRKILLQLIAIITLPVMVTAAGQEDRAPANHASAQPSLRLSTPSVNSTSALLDLQHNFSLGRGGFAGIAWMNSNVYWVSKWQSDSLFTVDTTSGAITSSFFIPGLDSIRGMAYDGSFVYAVDNTVNIYKIDTTTKTIVSTFPVAPFPIRGIAYDSVQNAFWVNNFATDIKLIDTTGLELNSIPQGSHGLGSMYSIAYDPYTSGGPFIWASYQGNATPVPNEQFIVRISVATGLSDIVHNVDGDLANSGLAGGICVTGWTGSTHSLIEVSQAAPSRLAIYELSDYVPPSVDGSMDTLHFNPGETIFPSFLTTPISFDLVTRNIGAATLDTLGVDLVVNDGTTDVFTGFGFQLGVPSFATSNVVIPSAYTPASIPNVTYSVSAQLQTGVQSDVDPANDTLSFKFRTSDTTIAHYPPGLIPTASIGIGDTVGGSIGVLINIPTTCFATSATVYLNNPTVGDSTRLELWDWNGITPGNLIASSAVHVFTAQDSMITLPFTNAPLQLTPASYLVAVHEYSRNISIFHTAKNFRNGTSWIFFERPTIFSWVPSEQLIGSLKINPFIDLNVWSQAMISVPELNNSVLSLYPNPANGEINITNPLAEKCKLTITDMQGKVVYTQILDGQQKEVVRTSEWSNGIYIARTESNGNSAVSKVVISH